MKLRTILAIILCILMLAGCGHPETPTEPTKESTMKPTESVPTEHDLMLARSILNMGNPYRLQQKIRAAQNGEDITIAYIGGSITEGLGVKPAQQYVTLSYLEFAENYANGGKVRSVNAGLSGTPSNLGLLRLQRDVLDHQPDIVFVEFAVNDSQDSQEKRCFESLIRTVLQQDNDPAVVLIFNRTEDGYTCQSTMGLIGLYYSLPMISVTDAITAEMEAGRMTWDDYSDDDVHPNPNGHRLTADYIAYLFRQAEKGTWEEYTVPVNPQNRTVYENVVMVTPDSEDFGNVTVTQLGDFREFRGNRTGFPVQWRAGGTGSMKFTVTGNAVFLIYHRNSTANMGAADVYVNGEKMMTVNACDPNGWGDPYSQLLASSKTVETFEVEIVPIDGGDKIFDVYGIAYSVSE